MGEMTAVVEVSALAPRTVMVLKLSNGPWSHATAPGTSPRNTWSTLCKFCRSKSSAVTTLIGVGSAEGRLVSS